MPLLGEAVTLAGPIKGVTLDVATARSAVHSSGEVVFRGWPYSTLAMTWGPSLFFEVAGRTAWIRIDLLSLIDGVSACSWLPFQWQPEFFSLFKNGRYLASLTRVIGMAC